MSFIWKANMGLLCSRIYYYFFFARLDTVLLGLWVLGILQYLSWFWSISYSRSSSIELWRNSSFDWAERYILVQNSSIWRYYMCAAKKKEERALRFSEKVIQVRDANTISTEVSLYRSRSKTHSFLSRLHTMCNLNSCLITKTTKIINLTTV